MSVDIPALTGRILEQVEKIVVGKEEQTRLMITAILSQGHILLDDLPGVGKTTLVRRCPSPWAASSSGCSSPPTCCPPMWWA